MSNTAAESGHKKLWIMMGEDPEERKSQIFELVRHVVPQYSDMEDNSQLQLSILSGGITNQLYRVHTTAPCGSPSTSSHTPFSVVVRVFGKETERIISREGEQFWQSQFLKTFGSAQNALVYEFLEGYHDMPFTDMPVYAKDVAIAMADFHVRATKASTFKLPFATETNHTNLVFTEWIDVATSEGTLSKLDAPSRAIYDAISLGSTVRDEVAEMLGIIQKHQHFLQEGCCHNDLLSANVMRLDRTKEEEMTEGVELKLIDFEYARKNYFYFDIANHFNEYTGFDCEWETYFPSDEQMKVFVSQYLQSMQDMTVSEATRTPVTEAEINRAVSYVKFFTLVSHLVWAIWAVIQQAFSAIDFEYMPYAKNRWERYLATKKEMIALLETMDAV